MLKRFQIIITVLLFMAAKTAHAQVCNGSLGAPVFNYTFGIGYKNGTPGPRLPEGTTNMAYFADNCGGPDDGGPGYLGQGLYTIQSEMGPTCKGGTWTTIGHDHTGDPNGYFMVINASETPSVFFTTKIDGSQLCPNVTYFFGAWVMNVLLDLGKTQGYIEPNLTFTISKPDGTILKTIKSGDIKASRNPQWMQYGALFTSPSDGSDVIIKITNNAPGGNGNDLALDDITVSPCGPLIQAGFNTVTDTVTRQNCANDNVKYTLVSQQYGYNTPFYQWQQNLDDGKGWVDISGQTSTTLNVAISNAAAGKYRYRVGILNASQAGFRQCTIYSDPLTVNVNPYPVTNIAPATGACVGYPLFLSATGGDTYIWNGPNGFTSALPNPSIQHAELKDNGVYTVTVLTNGCPTFGSTTVTVYPGATLSPMTNFYYCEGSDSKVQLNAVAANATHFKWHPSAGLSRDDIANPVASPATTTQYVVEAYNDGCPDVRPTQAVTVNVLKSPGANAGAAIKMFEGQTDTLKGTATGDSIIRTYWTPSDYLDNPETLHPLTSATHDITYTLHVVSALCGEYTSTVYVRVYSKLGVPNTFSPNGDGVNDLWNITNLNTYHNALITIYSRNGEQVYQSRGYAIPWDGSNNSTKLPVGTYYYIIDPREADLPRISGWVFLIR